MILDVPCFDCEKYTRVTLARPYTFEQGKHDNAGSVECGNCPAMLAWNVTTFV